MQDQYGGYAPSGLPFAEPVATGWESVDAAWWIVLAAAALAAGALMFVSGVRKLRYIAHPFEALVFSGKSYVTPEGTKLGYRVIRSGRAVFRWPILEQVERLDMRLLPVDIVVHNAYSQGNIPLQIHAIANVKIHSDPTFTRNAIERFLGRALTEVQTVAQQTLEGAVREVIAKLTPEEVNEDRLKFAERLIDAAEDDLHMLGLQLDTLKIQNVSDETGYLDSLGRPQIAAALRDAENSENVAQQEITRAQADSGRRANVSKAEAETKILSKQNALRQIRAELEGAAQSVEREAEAAAKTARAEAEKDLQIVRSQLEEKRLRAEVVIPAEIQREAQAILAIGEAAPTAENGRAAVEVLQLMSHAWKTMGPSARELYVIQHLEEIVQTVVSSLEGVEVDEVNVLDQGNGEGLASYAATYPQMVSSVLRAVAISTGVDVPAILAGPNPNEARIARRGGV
ncbi:MAG: SPFH domain-containing protein [Myxococcales bacterium]|nr:SPFH domain-containing protein [Myxococcales bacterium]